MVHSDASCRTRGNLMLKFWRRFLEPHASAPAIGAAFAFLLVLGAIVASTRSLLAFFSIEGLVIVVGGVIAVAFMSFEAEDVRKALHIIATMFRKQSSAPQDDLHQDMIEIIAW